MASLRSGYGLPSRPSDGVSTRRPAEPGHPGSVPRHRTRLDRSETETVLQASAQATSQSRLPSRVPQPSTIPRQTVARAQAAFRPPLDYQASSRGGSTNSTTDSNRSRSHTQSGSGSSTSSRSHEGSVRQPRSALRQKTSAVPQDAVAPRTTAPPSGPPSSIPRTKTTTDPSPEPQTSRYTTESPVTFQGREDNKETAQALSQSPIIYPELDRYRNHQQQPSMATEGHPFSIPHKLSTHDLPPPTPASLIFSGSSSQISASPSTKFSGSPGPGSYSRDTTPTSISSQSPGQTAIAKFNQPKGRQMSPVFTRPPVSRRRAGSNPKDVDVTSADPYGLAAVRESLNSSSSSSTVKDGDRNLKEKKKGRHLPPPPPSPPPRKSSQKFRKDGDEERASPAGNTNKPRSKSAGASSQEPSELSLPPSRLARPRRPSREGTPDMHFQHLNPSPIVHSNLSTTSLPGERRDVGTDGMTSDLDRGRGPPSLSTSQLPMSKDAAPRGTKQTGSRTLGVPEPTRPSRTPSPNVGSSFRFPFFGRKKTNQEGPSKPRREDREKRLVRKGPAAGTGHEGYGRVGAVRRRSGSSNLSRGFSDNETSQESLVSDDSFLSDRMNPVIISGGEIVENRNPSSELSRTGSDQGSPIIQQTALEPRPVTAGSRTRAWQPPAPSQFRTGSRGPSDSSDSEVSGTKPTLALRRSMQRLKVSPDAPLITPLPIDTSGVSSSPMTSFDTTIISDDESHLELHKEYSRGRDPAHPTPKKLVKRERSPRKWNLFGKSQKQHQHQHQHQSDRKEDTVSASVQAVERRPLAFYTMMDASEPDLDQETSDIQDVLRSADVYSVSPKRSTPELSRSGFQTPELPQASLPGAPKLSQKVYHDAPHIAGRPREAEPKKDAQVDSPGLSVENPQGPRRRPSRLQQVGRIPQVVSHRTEPETPRSFSRPFRASMHSGPPPAQNLDPDSIGKGPSPPNAPSPALDFPIETLPVETTADLAYSVSRARLSPEAAGDSYESEEFIRFSPRKNSDGTGGTSSSSGKYPYNSATAIIPRPEDPPVEDEVWDEYDDFLAPGSGKQPASATSSKGTPFHLETYQSKLSKEKPMESPTLATDRVQSTLSGPETSSWYSVDFTERIRNAFQPHPSPVSPSPHEHLGDDQKIEVSIPKPEPSTSTAASAASAAPAAPAPRRSLSPIKERDSGSSYTSSEDGSALSQVNLRVGSMTVSKWLTFGHVLFSDVRHELAAERESPERHSILVIDGLGNDDWSFYAAETYPGASFYNLSPRAPLPPQTQSSASAFPLTPPNHHQIQYLSHAEKFPFAAQSFTCVVYRFAVAAPESHYRNVLSEARRVLKPAGYLELSILDVDLNNMGNRGRRAVRHLKEKIHANDSEVNLASTADLMVRLIGNAGFYEVKAARVGVPVSGPRKHSKSSKNTTRTDKSGDKHKEQPSLSEMMSDESATADESITRMVARVGRWWYTRCYENAAGEATPESMWNNKALLRECSELGTSLKLMVCCGRAPDRVSSV